MDAAGRDAPHAGARIEIFMARRRFIGYGGTPPTRGRELKYAVHTIFNTRAHDAPHAGARIEILSPAVVGSFTIRRPPRGGEN